MNLRATRPILIGVPLVLIIWFLALLGYTFLEPPGRPVAVVSASGMLGAMEAVVAADGYILQVRGDTVIAISDEPGFVPRLYRAGALAVIAASAGGCIVSPSSPVRIQAVPSA